MEEDFFHQKRKRRWGCLNFLLLLDVFVFILCLAAHLHNFLLVVCLFVYLFRFLCRLNNASLCFLEFSNEIALLVIV